MHSFIHNLDTQY